jgi:cytochrome c-type biogenesis protein CcmE
MTSRETATPRWQSYTGSVPDLFKVGRHIVVDGRLRKGVFVAQPGSMITKCPSKYAPKQSGDSA